MSSLKCATVEVTDELKSRLGLVEKLAGLIDLVNSKEKIIELRDFLVWTIPIKVGNIFVSLGIRRDPDTGRIGIRIEERYSYFGFRTKRSLEISYPTAESRDRSIRMEVCAKRVTDADKHAMELLAHLDKAGRELVKLIVGLADKFELFQVDEYIRSRVEKGVGEPPRLIKEVISRYSDLIGEYILNAFDPRDFIVMAYAVDAFPLIKKFAEQRYGPIDPDKIAGWITDDQFLHSVFLALSAVSDNASEVARRLLKALPEHVSREYPRWWLRDAIAGIILRAAGLLSASVGQLTGDSRALKQAINSMYLASSGGEPEPLRMAELDTSWLQDARSPLEEGLSPIDAAREVLARRYRVGTQPSTNANMLEYAVVGSYISGHAFEEKAIVGLGDVLRAVST